MGIVIRFPWRHARASSTRDKGRSTVAGHSTSSGHRSENQRITSSYFRAVNVLASSSKRSKKRQSPAAKRPIVDMLTERAAAYAEAQAMRFDRSSTSMEADDSRKIPTAQAISVGKFRLAESPAQSDKSAMATVDQIRRRIEKAMEIAGEGPVRLAGELGLERNHIRDFLEGKKASLKTETMIAISERYSIPFKDLVVTKDKPVRATG
jgi:hypothetical protein